VDIWSVGVVFYILLCGFPPFYDDNNKKLFALIISANFTFPDPYWTDVSESAKDLVRKLLVVDPKKRLTAEEILRHEWMVEEASKTPLPNFQSNLKSYNAKRRFRSAIHAIQLTALLQGRRGTVSISDAMAGGAPPTTPMATESIPEETHREETAMTAPSQPSQKG
jgi:serine/threonine protein kinase